MLLYTSVYVCDNSCLGTTLLASILNTVNGLSEGNGTVQFCSPAASDLTDEIGCQQVRAHYVAASVHV